MTILHNSCQNLKLHYRWHAYKMSQRWTTYKKCAICQRSLGSRDDDSIEDVFRQAYFIAGENTSFQRGGLAIEIITPQCIIIIANRTTLSSRLPKERCQIIFAVTLTNGAFHNIGLQEGSLR